MSTYTLQLPLMQKILASSCILQWLQTVQILTLSTKMSLARKCLQQGNIFVRKKNNTRVFECFRNLEIMYCFFDRRYLLRVKYIHWSLHYRPVNSASNDSVRFQEIPLQCLVIGGALQTLQVAAEILKIPWAEARETCFLKDCRIQSPIHAITAEVAVSIFIFPYMRQNFQCYLGLILQMCGNGVCH